MVDSIPEKADFEKALKEWFLEAEKEENPFIDIRADDLHARIGDYPGPFHRMATCCEVMYENYRPQVDKILQFPPKGKGASMEIRYALPRSRINPGTKYVNITSAQRNHSPLNVPIATEQAEMFVILRRKQRNCPAPGCGDDKKGLHTLPGKLEDYSPCKNCKGSGVNPKRETKKPISVNQFEPCHECNGTGLRRRLVKTDFITPKWNSILE